MALRPAVFLDKDGTLVRNVPHNIDPARLALTPGAGDGLRRLCRHGYALIVVSNQDGIALGRFTEADLRAVLRQLAEMLRIEAVTLNGIYYCPHHPATGCACRKPQPGMLHAAAREQDIDLRRSWMIGDILDDVEAGRRAGCRTVLLDNGNETEWRMSRARMPNLLAQNLAQAAQHIVCLDGWP